MDRLAITMPLLLYKAPGVNTLKSSALVCKKKRPSPTSLHDQLYWEGSELAGFPGVRKVGLGLLLISRSCFTLREQVYPFPSCAALFDGYSEQRPHSQSLQRQRVVVLISNSDFVGHFLFS